MEFLFRYPKRVLAIILALSLSGQMLGASYLEEFYRAGADDALSESVSEEKSSPASEEGSVESFVASESAGEEEAQEEQGEQLLETPDGDTTEEDTGGTADAAKEKNKSDETSSGETEEMNDEKNITSEEESSADGNVEEDYFSQQEDVSEQQPLSDVIPKEQPQESGEEVQPLSETIEDVDSPQEDLNEEVIEDISEPTEEFDTKEENFGQRQPVDVEHSETEVSNVIEREILEEMDSVDPIVANNWLINPDGSFTSAQPVGMAEYALPEDDRVRIRFVQVTQPATITWSVFPLEQRAIENNQGLLNFGVRILSDMPDGSFTANLTLPNPTDQPGVMWYSEDGEHFYQMPSTNQTGEVTSTGLTHFTDFVLTSSERGVRGSFMDIVGDGGGSDVVIVEGPTGTAVVTKYECLPTVVIGEANRPAANGATTIPADCSRSTTANTFEFRWDEDPMINPPRVSLGTTNNAGTVSGEIGAEADVFISEFINDSLVLDADILGLVCFGGTTGDLTDNLEQVNIAENNTVHCAAYNLVPTFTVTMCKQDQDGQPLQGWQLTLGAQNQTTDADGCVDFTGIVAGEYVIDEADTAVDSRYRFTSVTQDGTVLSTTNQQQTVTISADSTITYVNTRYFNIFACKQDTNGDFLQDWQLNLTGTPAESKNTGDQTQFDSIGVGIVIPDSDGCTIFTRGAGDYTISETEQTGFDFNRIENTVGTVVVDNTAGGVSPQHTFTLSDDVTFTFFNEVETHDVTVCKVETHTGDGVENWDMTLGSTTQATVLNAGDACTTFTDITTGDYTLREAAAQTGSAVEYDFTRVEQDGTNLNWTITSGDPIEGTVTVNSDTTFTFFNHELADVEICKVLDGASQTGWEMTLTNSDGDVLSRDTENRGGMFSDGCAVFEDTPIGEYTIDEEDVSGFGFIELQDALGNVISSTQTQNSVSIDNANHTFTYFNQTLAEVTVCKEDDRNTRLSGWEMTLTEDTTDPTMLTFTGTTQSTADAATHGCITFADVPIGDYTLQETDQDHYTFAELENSAGTVTGWGNGDVVTVPAGGQTFTFINNRDVYTGQICKAIITNANTLTDGWEVSLAENVAANPETFAGITGDGTVTGCTEYSVAFGEYSLSETLQTDFEFDRIEDSRAGEDDLLTNPSDVVIDEDNITFTFYNREDLGNGTLNLTKYECDEMVNDSDFNETDHRPDAVTGAISNIPTGCRISDTASTYEFRYGFDNDEVNGPFNTSIGMTSGAGTLVVSIPAQVDIYLSEYVHDVRVSDETVLGFLCTGDDGDIDDNFERTQVDRDGQTHCVVFNEVVESDVRVCKEDQFGNAIMGWGISLNGQIQFTNSAESGFPGCTIFRDVPQGTAILEEELRAGWEFEVLYRLDLRGLMAVTPNFTEDEARGGFLTLDVNSRFPVPIERPIETFLYVNVADIGWDPSKTNSVEVGTTRETTLLPGDEFEYTLTLDYTGVIPAVGTTIIDDIDPGVNFLEGTVTFRINGVERSDVPLIREGGQRLTWDISGIIFQPGDQIVITYQAQVDNNAPNGLYDNVVRVVGDDDIALSTVRVGEILGGTDQRLPNAGPSQWLPLMLLGLLSAGYATGTSVFQRRGKEV